MTTYESLRGLVRLYKAYEALSGLERLGSFASVAVHEMGLPTKVKKGVPGILGRRAWKK